MNNNLIKYDLGSINNVKRKEEWCKIFQRDSNILLSFGNNELVVDKDSKTVLFKHENDKNISQMKLNEIEEHKNIKTISVVQMKDEIQPIIDKVSQWIGYKKHLTIFDSSKNKWEMNNSDFDSLLRNKNNLAILIKIENGPTIGGFINSTIKQNVETIIDKNCFVFTNSDNPMIQYKIENGQNNVAFTLFKLNHNTLFKFGNDLVIGKKNHQKQNKFITKNLFFNYPNKRNQLYPNNQTNDTFKTRRILVVQFYQRSSNHRQFKLLKPKKFPIETIQLEQWTQLKTKETIYDSTKNVEKDISILYKILMNKVNLVFFIETNKDINIGCFVESKIMKFGEIKNEKGFVFIKNNEQFKHYSIKETKNFSSFELHSNEDNKLFTFGKVISIFKNKINEIKGIEEQEILIDDPKNIFKMLKGYNNLTLKRLRVIQME